MPYLSGNYDKCSLMVVTVNQSGAYKILWYLGKFIHIPSRQKLLFGHIQ
jgi:hypothetical protein